MTKRITAALLALAIAAPAAAPAVAFAQPRDNRWQGDRGGNWDPSQHYNGGGRHAERRMGRNDRIYRGRDNRYYCRRSDGTTGLVVGAIAGGVLGGAIGGSTLSTLLGGAGGAVLGSSIERGQVRCR